MPSSFLNLNGTPMDAARFLKSSFLRVLKSDTEPAKASAFEAAELVEPGVAGPLSETGGCICEMSRLLESMAANLKGALRYKTPKF
jgi:hypothetical protein